MNPTTVDFGDVGAGISTAPFVQLTIINKGQLASGPIQAQVQFTDAELFHILGNGCIGARVPPLGECSLQVQFRPVTPTGLKQARVVVSASPGGDLIIPVQGNAVVDTSPKLVASANTANFGTRALGTLSMPISFTITNTGANPTGPINVALTGGAPGVFGANTNCSAPLPGGGMCFVALTFRPSTVIQEQADLMLTANPGSVASIHMIGTGASISLATDATSANFDPLIVGFASQPVSITVSNNGSDPGLVTTNIVGMHPNDFGLVTDNCSGSTLGGGAQCTLSVRFTPQAARNRTASLVIDANGSSKTVALSGIGATQTDPKFVVSPLSLAFGNETVGATTAPQMFTVTNEGATTSSPITVSLTGSDPTSFGVTSTCTTLAPAASCTVMATFHPLVAGGRSAGVVVSAPGATSASVSVSGVGM